MHIYSLEAKAVSSCWLWQSALKSPWRKRTSNACHFSANAENLRTQFAALRKHNLRSCKRNIKNPFFLLFHAGFHLSKPWFSRNPFLAMWSKVDSWRKEQAELRTSKDSGEVRVPSRQIFWCLWPFQGAGDLVCMSIHTSVADNELVFWREFLVEFRLFLLLCVSFWDHATVTVL